jgi:Ca-activated chloride channel family protein
MIHFHSPWFALLLPVVALVLWRSFRLRPPSVTVSTAEPFVSAAGRGRWTTRVPTLVGAVGLVLLVVALMRPQRGVERTVQRAEGIDIMLVLDVSGSMEAIDVPGGISNSSELERALQSGRVKTRIEVAREELRAFVQSRPSDRIGLIAFARQPYVVSPPTLDHEFLLNHLAMLEAGMLPDGTGIAPPVASSVNRLKDSEAKRRVLVVFTDGENNIDAEITPLQAAKLAHTFDVTIYTVGVGGDRAVVRTRDLFGRNVFRRQDAGFRPELLRAMAEVTEGRYFAARDADAFSRTMDEIDELETVTLETPRYTDYRERFLPWLLAGAALLLLGYVLEHTLFLTIP